MSASLRKGPAIIIITVDEVESQTPGVLIYQQYCIACAEVIRLTLN